MRKKRKIWAGIVILAVVGAALWMRELASWRPVTLDGISGWSEELSVSRDGRFAWMGDVGGQGQAFCLDPGISPAVNRVVIPPEGENFRLYKGIEEFPKLVRRYDGTHFKLQPGAAQITVPRCWHTAFSLPHREIYTDISDSEDGGGWISTWSMTDGRLKKQFRYGKGNFSVHGAFSPDGKWVLLAQARGEKYGRIAAPYSEFPVFLSRYDVRSGKPVASLPVDSEGGIGRLEFSPDGNYFLVGVGAGNTRALVFDASSWKLAWRADGILNADWLPDGQLGITQAEGLEWRDAATGNVTQTRFGPLSGTRFWTTSPDGRWIYAADNKGIIRRWRAR